MIAPVDVETIAKLREVESMALLIAEDFVRKNAGHDGVPRWEDMDANTRVRFAVSFFRAAAVRQGFARGPE